jgi:hypothetical protein
MIEFLTHIYMRGTQPFRSLSALCDEEALQIMKGLYIEGSAYWGRFKDPQDYLQARRQTERWLHQSFIAKGGKPQQAYPIYFVVGDPPWLDRVADPVTIASTDKIQVPVSIFDESDISFTYPDSMVTLLLENLKNPEIYQPDYHGRLFTLAEMRDIVALKGLPDEGWETKAPDDLAHYIEAQVWNRQPLLEFMRQRQIDDFTAAKPGEIFPNL